MKKRQHLVAGLLAVAATAFNAGAAQAGELYTIFESSNTLVKIDPVTFSQTVIGATGVGGAFGDLAYNDSSGVMYWIAGRGNNNLYTINLATGAATLVGAHGIDDLFSLGWAGPSLVAQSTNGSVYTLDALTGAATVIGGNSVYPGGFDYNTSSGTLISVGAGSGGIHAISTADGSASFLGSDGNVNDADIAFDAGRNAYWVADYNNSLYLYDATTLTRTTVLDGTLGDYTGALEYVGASVTPVPEPEIYAMMGIGLGLMGWAGRRRKQS